LIFPGSRGKTTETALVRAYEGSTILSRTTRLASCSVQVSQLGCTVLIPEYPGYGMSSGWASESGCYEAADAAYHYLTETLRAHPTQIVVAGWRLQCRCGHRPRRPHAGGRFDRARCVHEHP